MQHDFIGGEVWKPAHCSLLTRNTRTYECGSFINKRLVRALLAASSQGSSAWLALLEFAAVLLPSAWDQGAWWALPAAYDMPRVSVEGLAHSIRSGSD